MSNNKEFVGKIVSTDDGLLTIDVDKVHDLGYQTFSCQRCPSARANVLTSKIQMVMKESIDEGDNELAERFHSDSSAGKIDIDVIMTGKPKSLRDKMQEVLSTFADLEKQLGLVEDATLYQALTRKPDISEDDAKRLVDQLVKEGILYSPKPGHLKRNAPQGTT